MADSDSASGAIAAPVPVVLASTEAIEAVVGQELGPGEWTAITQQRIDMFAAATDDHQWIHVDPVRAADGPYGTTIAHGHLTSALLPSLLRSVYRFEGYRMSVNYGSEQMRFPTPVPVGSRIRARAVLAGVERTPKGTRVEVRSTIEIEGVERPALVATTLSLVVF